LSPRAKPAPTTFEAAFAELQQVVLELEGGAVDLERALALFQRGTALASACERLIATAEQRVKRLTPESASPMPDATADP